MATEFPRQNRFHRAICGLLFAGLAALGCGGGAGQVSGVITFKGQPLPAGRITLLGENAVMNANIYNGSFTIIGIPVGRYKIKVESFGTTVMRKAEPGKAKAGKSKKTMMPPSIGLMLPPDKAKEVQAKVDAGETAEAVKGILIPAHYSDPEKSGLVVNVTRGKTTCDLDLQ